eukprot:gene13659-10079_t
MGPQAVVEMQLSMTVQQLKSQLGQFTTMLAAAMSAKDGSAVTTEVVVVNVQQCADAGTVGDKSDDTCIDVTSQIKGRRPRPAQGEGGSYEE